MQQRQRRQMAANTDTASRDSHRSRLATGQFSRRTLVRSLASSLRGHRPVTSESYSKACGTRDLDF